MSVKIMAEVWALDLPQNEKFVLLAFGDHADDDGICRPSVDRVAWKTGYSESQVQRIGAQLRKLELMTPIGVFNAITKQVTLGARPVGRGQFVLYRITPEKGRKLRPFNSAKGSVGAALSGVKGRTGADKRVASDAQKGSHPCDPESSVGTISEPSEKKESPLGSCEAAASPAPVWALEYLRLWNENRGLLPECRELPKGRVDKLRVRGAAPTRGSEEPSPFQAKFLEAAKRAAATPFLRGENDRGWRCTFDYLIANDINILEILEGKFDGGGHGKSGSNRGARNAVHSEGADGYGERAGRVVLDM